MSVGYKGKQGNVSGLLDSQGQGALVFRAGAGNTPGKYLAPVGDKAAEGIRVLVVDLEFLGTEFTDLLFKEDLSLTAAPAETILAIAAVGIRVSVAPIRPGTMFTFHIFFVKHYNSYKSARHSLPKVLPPN
jgi:hypothetical protein